jgi:two-component system cell cycle sensor histidine kinase/response regulator CckA
LEDDRNDAALIRATLAADAIACAIHRVQNRADFSAALEQGGWDLILSDFSLPDFDGLTATALAHARSPDLPLILVSGTLGEERAIDALKSGATDYVLKERLARLALAVRRAMQEVEAKAEHQRMEGQFIEAQKMEVLGQLAGGVAHDFNNILGVILGYGHLITSTLPADSPLQKYTEEIRHASERAAGLTRQLLVFSRKQTVQPVVLDLNEVLQDVQQMLRRLIDENIAMAIVPGQGLGRVKADPGYIGQVLMNLVVNARDAMPRGGKLTIATANVTLGKGPGTTPPGAAPGDYVVLSVNDTGTGMTAAIKANLFKAFFTTKPLGKGTGLGLATCQMIAQQSGGQIDVESELGQGTTFRIYLPRVEEALDFAASPCQGEALAHGTETVLVVEDEPSLRQLVRSVLGGQGYEVLTASNGQDALQVAQAHVGSPIRLVVTDVIMPLMGGREMAERMKATYPGLKILFTSGYSDNSIAHQGLLATGMEFLAKPYTPALLVRKVRELLDPPRTPAPA